MSWGNVLQDLCLCHTQRKIAGRAPNPSLGVTLTIKLYSAVFRLYPVISVIPKEGLVVTRLPILLGV